MFCRHHYHCHWCHLYGCICFCYYSWHRYHLRRCCWLCYCCRFGCRCFAIVVDIVDDISVVIVSVSVDVVVCDIAVAVVLCVVIVAIISVVVVVHFVIVVMWLLSYGCCCRRRVGIVVVDVCVLLLSSLLLAYVYGVLLLAYFLSFLCETRPRILFATQKRNDDVMRTTMYSRHILFTYTY